MPAFGLAAVPSPTKNRRIAPGYQPAYVAADGDPTAAAVGATSSPVDTDAAAGTVRDTPPNSRRDAAATVHANGAAAGPSPDPPEANHSNTAEPTPLTPPAAARGAVITGAAATGADTTGADTAGAAGADTTASLTATVGVESPPPTGATTGSRDGTDTSTGFTPETPGTTTTPA